MLRWLMKNQERLRPQAEWVLFLTVAPLILASSFSDPQVAPMVAGITMAPFVLSRVPRRRFRLITTAYALFVAVALILAFSPIGDPVKP